MNRALFLITLLTLTQQAIQSNSDCLNDGLYYTRYEHVCCNCPCDRYKQSYDRGRCEQCWHFRTPGPQFLEQEDE